MTAKKKIITVLLGIILVISAGLIFVANNVNTLFVVANGCDQPSKLYYLTTARIYEVLDNDDCVELSKRLNQSKYSYLHDLYIHVLGIAGCTDLKEYLIDLYGKCTENPDMRSTCIKIVNAMGISNNKEYVPFLESLLEENTKSNLPTQYYVSRALYLLTGKSYPYFNNGDKPNKLVLTEELKSARDIITETANRQRTPEEMVAIDSLLFRPPGW